MSDRYDVDVIQMSDFRLPGGTTSSIAEEVRAQSDAGLSTALIHIAGSVTNYPLGWSAHIRNVLDLPGVRLLTPHSPLRAKVLIVRHPTVLYSTRTSLKSIQADHIVVVANHAAIDAAGTQHYDVAATDAKAREIFGRVPIWAPIGPVVRGTMLQQTRDVPLREVDWFNIFSFPDTFPERTGFVEERPVIGRHSRPQRGKWPSSGEDIVAAYPDSPGYEVRILGGAQIAHKLLGHVPANWEVVPFGGEDPTEFLKRIDFWVYMHHPDLKEAFGRAAMESLAAGCVAVMPPYMAELFGDAALYSDPQGVRALVDEFAADKEKFLAQSRRAQAFAHRFSPQMHVDRLAELGAVPPDGPRAPAAKASALHSTVQTAPGLTLLIVDGKHDERSFAALTDAVPDSQCPVRVTIGDWPAPVGPETSVFVSSARRMNMSEEVWTDYATARLNRLLADLRPQQVVYSGPLPPRAVLDSLKGSPVRKVWMQQPLSDPEAREQAIKAATEFHTVFAPSSPANGSQSPVWESEK